MQGQPTPSQSGVGTSVKAGASPRIPKAMFVGGGFFEPELEAMLQVPEGKDIPWIAADPDKKDEVRTKGLDAMMGTIVENAKEKLKDARIKN